MTDRKRSAGRPMLYPERILANFKAGTLARIDKLVHRPVEYRSDFIRTAVENEIARRTTNNTDRDN